MRLSRANRVETQIRRDAFVLPASLSIQFMGLAAVGIAAGISNGLSQ